MQVLILFDRSPQEEEDEHRDNHDNQHEHYIGYLREVTQHECRDQVAEHLRAHVERLEEGEIETFRLFS